LREARAEIYAADDKVRDDELRGSEEEA